jgi:ubiquinone/menaquinone biosynthesis C-methylase UbiE
MDSREYFDEVSGRWDSIRSLFFSDNVREKVVSRARIEYGKIAVDLGAGTGFITEGLIASGIKIIAVDQSRAMIDEMRRKFGNRSDIEYRLAEAGEIPVGDEEADYVFANMFLHHVEDPGKTIREMARMLRAGGMAIISDLDKHGFEFLRTEQKDRWLGFDRADIERWFAAAGFTNIVIESAGEDCCAKSDCGCEEAGVNIFIASGGRNE